MSTISLYCHGITPCFSSSCQTSWRVNPLGTDIFLSFTSHHFLVKTSFLKLAFIPMHLNLAPVWFHWSQNSFTLLAEYFHFCWASHSEYRRAFSSRIFCGGGGMDKGLVWILMQPFSYCFLTQCSRKSMQLESLLTVDKGKQAGHLKAQMNRNYRIYFRPVRLFFFNPFLGSLKLKSRDVRWLIRDHTAS